MNSKFCRFLVSDADLKPTKYLCGLNATHVVHGIPCCEKHYWVHLRNPAYRNFVCQIQAEMFHVEHCRLD